ncbi:MAG: LicD family protein [Lachnospiraceae bacterium]|nr:LicD family protein [Lachnospiraceae bacterium]
MTDEYGLKEVFETELNMLKTIDAVCRKHEIVYTLEAGTLIGAVREKGFIPWDDDADIIMTRENWEKFKTVAVRELPEGMQFQLPYEMAKDGRFYDFIGRVVYLPSRRHAPNEKSEFFNEKINHLWIDIFVMDNIPDSGAGAFIASSGQKLLYALSLGHRKTAYINSSTGKKILLLPFTMVGKLIPLTALCKWKDRWSAKDRKKNTSRVYVSNYPPEWFDLKLDRDWIKEVRYMQFEDTELPVPCGYHEILTAGYGDYMKRPDIKDRKVSHETETQKSQT